MFPYATYGSYFNGTFTSKQEHQEYWTGFYTSRPAFKYMIREGSNLLQVKYILKRKITIAIFVHADID